MGGRVIAVLDGELQDRDVGGRVRHEQRGEDTVVEPTYIGGFGWVWTVKSGSSQWPETARMARGVRPSSRGMACSDASSLLQLPVLSKSIVTVRRAFIDQLTPNELDVVGAAANTVLKALVALKNDRD